MRAGSQSPLGAETEIESAVVDGAAAEDDFLVVKRHDIYEAAPSAAPASAVEEPKKQKRKKLKISKASASGSRVVFDEEGRAQDPLAQLNLPHDAE
jgi:hypothetical protein